MANLIYSAIASADGYVEDAAGSFDWAAPDEELLCFVNDLQRPAGTCLYGRRMDETMLYWETARTVPTGHDMTVGGADLAGQAIRAGLAGELQLFLVPIVVGGGKPALPSGVRSDWNSWTPSGSPAVLSTSGTAPNQRDHLAGCRRPIAAPGLATQP